MWHIIASKPYIDERINLRYNHFLKETRWINMKNRIILYKISYESLMKNSFWNIKLYQILKSSLLKSKDYIHI
jgi:hypothetical protein